jgi:hypothetical protein
MKGILLVLFILAAVFMNLRAIIGPFHDTRLGVTIQLADCNSEISEDCILKGSTHYEFFTNDTFVTDSDGVVTRLPSDKIAVQMWKSNDNN